MKILFSVFLSFFCSFCSADVSIQLIKGVELLAHNGKELLSDSSVFQQDGVQIKNGIHQIVVQYSGEIFKSPTDSIIESTGTYIIVFEAIDERLLLGVSPLKTSYDFSKFKIFPKWVLTDDDGKIKDIKVAELVKEGFQLNRDYEKELAVFNMKDSPVAVVTPIESPLSNNEYQSDIAEKMLRYWYENSTPDVKAEFIKWIGN